MTTTENPTFLPPFRDDMKDVAARSVNTPSKRFVLRNASVLSKKSTAPSHALIYELANERPNTNNQNW
jgi:hypothetical protein